MKMAKGIIYCMTTIVPGLVKIGKTGTENFEQRMYNLERNGYVNVVGLKRRFAIEVEDYDEKEQEIRYDTEPEQTVIILNGSLYQIIDSEEELELPFW